MFHAGKKKRGLITFTNAIKGKHRYKEADDFIIIALGEIEHYRKQYEKPYSIFPTGFLNSDFVFKHKNHVDARSHFLWLGSSAVIHKGLDLLIDVFRERDDITLHICGLDQLSRELLDIPKRSNIIDYGFISINSDTFLNIAGACSYSILPSCSEGMATSVTTSMLHGMVPVVIKDTGFNRLGEYAIFLDDYKVDYLDDMLSRLAKIDPSELEVLSQKVRAFACRNFSPEAYENQLRSILAEIIQ
jgi:glycosyltransferase involved in cell wall biosynthesis